MPPVPVTNGDMRKVVVVTKPSARLLRILTGVDDRKDGLSGYAPRASQEFLNLAFRKAFQDRKSQQQIETARRRVFFDAAFFEEGLDGGVGVSQGVGARVHSPGTLTLFAKRPDQIPHRASGIEERIRFGKHFAKETRRFLKKGAEKRPTVALLPVAFAAGLEVIAVVPFRRNGYSGLQGRGLPGTRDLLPLLWLRALEEGQHAIGCRASHGFRGVSFAE